MWANVLVLLTKAPYGLNIQNDSGNLA